MATSTLKQKMQRIKADISQEVTLVAVTKGVPVEKINEAIDAGVTDIGENKLQEAERKFSKLKANVKKHFLGHLQTNKVKKIVALFDCVQSIDSIKTAELINREAFQQNKVIEGMMQINIGNEPQKQGIIAEQLYEFYDKLLGFHNLKIIGIMCIAPELDIQQKEQKKQKENKEKLHILFKKMKELQEDLNLKHCSMGMSNDYRIAIEERSTMIRLGQAIFGERKKEHEM